VIVAILRTVVLAPVHKLGWVGPEEALDVTRNAVFAGGAGQRGDYGRCSGFISGGGTFLGGRR
jgi:hypothetical protein